MKRVPRSVPGPNEVLVRVMACSVNPVDIKIRSGSRSLGPDLPAILGIDMSGVVEAVGPAVTTFSIGDAVYGCAGGVKGMAGVLAEYVVTDPELQCRNPENLDWDQAAAMPLVCITA